MPQSIEPFVYATTGAHCSCSQFVEAFNIDASLHEWRAQYAVHGPVMRISATKYRVTHAVHAGCAYSLGFGFGSIATVAKSRTLSMKEPDRR
jgi:hypothetical protein